MFMIMHIALPTKLFLPDMAQVTAVPAPSGLNVKRVSLSPAIGLKNSSLMRTSSAGLDSTIVIFPSPTSLLPAQP